MKRIQLFRRSRFMALPMVVIASFLCGGPLIGAASAAIAAANAPAARPEYPAFASAVASAAPIGPDSPLPPAAVRPTKKTPPENVPKPGTPHSARPQAPNPAAAAEPVQPRLMLPIRIDMGHGPWLPGTFMCGSEDRETGYAWIDGMVRNGYRRSQTDTWLCDFVEGDDATFVIAVEPDTAHFDVEVTLGDPELARGPVRVSVAERVVADSVTTAAGQSQTVRFTTAAKRGRIEIRFQSRGCSGFAVNGVQVSGPPLSHVGRLYPDSVTFPPIPDPATLPKMTLERKQRLLKQICDYLVDTSPRQGCFSYHGAWYQNGYPIRTLLAGSRILKQPEYAEAAFRCLDRFVSRQGTDANWLSAYFGSSGCDTLVPGDSTTSNLADVGTMVLCLSAAAPYAPPERRDRYIAAARLYADSISIPNQMLDGSFPNRLWAGVDFGHPYTVATATQTAALAALAMVTGESRYLNAAEMGARWLTGGTILDDGRLVLHPYNDETLIVRESTDFGDLFYVGEALLWARRATQSESLKQEIDTTLEHWLFGAEGAHAKTSYGYWWPPMDVWSSSKMAGMIFILADHPRRETDPVISVWLDRALGWLSNRNRSQSIGVLAEPATPRGAFGLAATGFAGIGVAGAIDRSALYP